MRLVINEHLVQHFTLLHHIEKVIYPIINDCSFCLLCLLLSDIKALKDENLPPVICQDVENFQ